MKRILAVLTVITLLFVCGGCFEQKPTEFTENSPLLVGTWLMTTFDTDAGESYDFSKEDVLFVYTADGTGQKLVKGEVEFSFTYSYDGEYLYTTAAYPNGRTNLMKDPSKVEGDTATTYSYDEKATIVLKRVSTATTTKQMTTPTTDL